MPGAASDFNTDDEDEDGGEDDVFVRETVELLPSERRRIQLQRAADAASSTKNRNGVYGAGTN